MRWTVAQQAPDRRADTQSKVAQAAPQAVGEPPDVTPGVDLVAKVQRGAGLVDRQHRRDLLGKIRHPRLVPPAAQLVP